MHRNRLWRYKGENATSWLHDELPLEQSDQDLQLQPGQHDHVSQETLHTENPFDAIEGINGESTASEPHEARVELQRSTRNRREPDRYSSHPSRMT